MKHGTNRVHTCLDAVQVTQCKQSWQKACEMLHFLRWLGLRPRHSVPNIQQPPLSPCNTKAGLTSCSDIPFWLQTDQKRNASSISLPKHSEIIARAPTERRVSELGLVLTQTQQALDCPHIHDPLYTRSFLYTATMHESADHSSRRAVSCSQIHRKASCLPHKRGRAHCRLTADIP